MKRVAILGRGGVGKSALAQQLSIGLEVPVVELDSMFWQPGPRPAPEREWAEIQRKFIARERWIIDGDLGPYDTGLELRLPAADTIVAVDFPLWRCVWRAVRRSRENREFWTWVCRYRRDSLPTITAAIATPARCGASSTVRPDANEVLAQLLSCSAAHYGLWDWAFCWKMSPDWPLSSKGRSAAKPPAGAAATVWR